MSLTNDTVAFWWYYDDQQTYTLPQCSIIDLHITPSDAAVPATPPYTFLTYARNQVPTVIPAGDGSAAFEYQVRYPQGTQLLLAMVDANGESGGTGKIVTVTAPDRNSTNCIPADLPEPSVSMALTPANNPLTCEPVNIAMTGGRPPYTATIARAGSASSNMTFSGVGTWTNDLQAGGAVMIAVSDSTGTYSRTSDLIFSGGGSNKTCLEEQKTPVQPKEDDVVPKGLIAGVAVGVAALVCACFGLFFYCRKRRRANSSPPNRNSMFGSIGKGTHQRLGSFSSNNMLNSAHLSPSSPDAHSVHSLQALHPVRFRVVNPDDADDASITSSPRQQFQSQAPYTPPQQTDWSSSVNPRRHSQDQSQPRSRRSSGGPNWSMTASLPETSTDSDDWMEDDYYTSVARRSGRLTTESGGMDRIIQHEDAGAAAIELPPTYRDERPQNEKQSGFVPIEKGRI